MSHIARDVCKVERIINSCKTYAQAAIAYNIKYQFCKTYSNTKEAGELHDKALRVLCSFEKPQASK